MNDAKGKVPVEGLCFCSGSADCDYPAEVCDEVAVDAQGQTWWVNPLCEKHAATTESAS